MNQRTGKATPTFDELPVANRRARRIVLGRVRGRGTGLSELPYARRRRRRRTARDGPARCFASTPKSASPAARCSAEKPSSTPWSRSGPRPTTTCSTTTTRRKAASGTAWRMSVTSSSASSTTACDVEEIRDGRNERLGIHHWAAKFVGRGVLVDVLALRRAEGRPIDPLSKDSITVAELEHALEAQQTTLQPGAIVLLRTGWMEAYEQLPRDRKNTMSSFENIALDRARAEPRDCRLALEPSGRRDRHGLPGRRAAAVRPGRSGPAALSRVALARVAARRIVRPGTPGGGLRRGRALRIHARVSAVACRGRHRITAERRSDQIGVCRIARVGPAGLGPRGAEPH